MRRSSSIAFLRPRPVTAAVRSGAGDFPEEEPLPRSCQASSVRQHESQAELDAADEVTMLRAFMNAGSKSDGRTAVGLSGILPTSWRGVVRFLEAYAQGEQAELKTGRQRLPNHSSSATAWTTSKPFTTKRA